jgi:Ca2+/H+ antiporter
VADVAILLLVAALATACHTPPRRASVLAFVVAGAALAALASIVSFATEHVGGRVGPAVTGVLPSTLANLPELFIVILALWQITDDGEATKFKRVALIGLYVTLGAFAWPDQPGGSPSHRRRTA